MSVPRVLAVGTANPPQRFTQEEVFRLAGYTSPRIRNIFVNSDIDYRYFYIDPKTFTPDETSDELNARYLRGAMETGCHAIEACLKSAGLTPRDVDMFSVASCTGYVCPDVGSRLIGHMRFRDDVERAPLIGLGCAGAMPALQRVWDYAAARPGRKALMLAVEVCSASYCIDDELETVIGNAICGDGAAALLISTESNGHACYPQVIDFQTYLDPTQLDKVGFEQKDGKLRIILALEIRDLAAPLIERSLETLLNRNGLRREDIRFWVAHPGGRKVINNVQENLGLSEEQVRFSKDIYRNFGNMSSATVLFVLEEVVKRGDPHAGDLGVMIALGPGMAAETALLRW